MATGNKEEIFESRYCEDVALLDPYLVLDSKPLSRVSFYREIDHIVETRRYDVGTYTKEALDLLPEGDKPKRVRLPQGRAYLNLSCDPFRLGKDTDPNLYDAGWYHVIKSQLDNFDPNLLKPLIYSYQQRRQRMNELNSWFGLN